MGILALIVFAIAIAAMVVVFLVKRGKEDELETKPSVEPEKPAEKPVEKPKEPLQEPQKPKVDNDKPKEEKESEKPKEEENGMDVIDLFVPFKGIVDVKEGSKTDDYLYEIANEAYFQFFEGVSVHGLPSLFREENFPQIYNFYGEDGDEVSAFKTLAGWLLAMQLAELRPQDRTAIYKIGYEMGGCDKDSKLYGWKFKCDPNICRMVASAIYAAMRGVCTPDTKAMREECGGISILDTIKEVRESDSFDLSHSYYIDLREFMPTAAGPYAPNYKDRSKIGGYPYPNDDRMDDYNLAIDRAIRDMVVEKYNLYEGKIPESQIEDSVNIQRTVQAIADKDVNCNHLFGGKRRVGDYEFWPVFSSYALGQEVYPSLAKELCELVDDCIYIGSYQRCILQGNDSQETPPQYGRLRPGCSWQVEAHRHSDSDDRQNVLVDFYIEDNDGNPTGYYNADGEWVNKSGIHSPEEYNDVMKDQLWANSYPSGHSAGIMSACLLLIELLPKQADKILAATNRFAVNRTIARYHWNSDTIQGRVLATCVAPIIRCCSDWKERFKKALECLKSV